MNDIPDVTTRHSSSPFSKQSPIEPSASCFEKRNSKQRNPSMSYKSGPLPGRPTTPNNENNKRRAVADSPLPLRTHQRKLLAHYVNGNVTGLTSREPTQTHKEAPFWHVLAPVKTRQNLMTPLCASGHHQAPPSRLIFDSSRIKIANQNPP